MSAAPALVAYSICRACAAVYPAERQCPTCAGDQVAAQAIAAATAACAAEPAMFPSFVPRPRARTRVIAAAAALGALLLGLGIGLGWAVATHPRVLTMSSIDAADR
jgi:hypothetical protein